MTFDELLASMTPEIHRTMKTAVEIGKWPDGRRLSQEEKETCLQVIIAYDAANLNESERVGYIDYSDKKSSCASDNTSVSEQTITIDSTPNPTSH